MDDVEGLARTMYWLEITLNQGKKFNDWNEQPESVKREWAKCAEAVYRVTN